MYIYTMIISIAVLIFLFFLFIIHLLFIIPLIAITILYLSIYNIMYYIYIYTHVRNLHNRLGKPDSKNFHLGMVENPSIYGNIAMVCGNGFAILQKRTRI